MKQLKLLAVLIMTFFVSVFLFTEKTAGCQDQLQSQAYQGTLRHGPRLELRFMGGLNYFLNGDVNDGTQGWCDLESGFVTSLGYSQTGEINPIQKDFGLGGDLIISLSRRLGIGLGAEYIQGTETSELTFTNSVEVTMTNEPKMRAIPIKLSLFLTQPLSKGINFCLHGGAGYYMTEFTYDWTLGIPGNRDEIHYDTSANGFGYHGGIGLEFYFNPNVALVIEGQGRYAKIQGFEGTATGIEGSYEAEWDGTLYYVEGTEYPNLLIREEEPTGYQLTREAIIDFSGFSLKVGIKIRL